MSYLQQQMNFLKYDKRLLEMNLKNGTVTAEEYTTHIEQLKDDAANAEQVKFESEKETPVQESMNGESHPADTQNFTPNTDPFGSGY